MTTRKGTTVYTADTLVNYRGVLIRVNIELSRDPAKGLKRYVQSRAKGHLPDMFDTDYADSALRETHLNGERVEYVKRDYANLRARASHTTYIEEHRHNCDRPTDPIGRAIQDLKMDVFSPPKPTPLSEQVETTLNEVQDEIDQYIEDRYIEFDESELQYGLANTLADPVGEVSVDAPTPTDKHDDEEIRAPSAIAGELEPERELS